jgi:hypothetical protein
VSGSNLFVVNPGWGTIGEYTTSGGIVNPSLVSGLYGLTHIAASGSDLFVPLWAGFTVGEYTTSGGVVNPSLISESNEPFGIAVSGSNIFVTNYYAGTIGEYGTDGSTVNASLISGLSGPEGLVLSGTNLFVASWGNDSIGEYGTDGSTVNAALVSELSQPTCIAVSGSNLFVTNCAAGTIGEYGMDGSTVNAALVSGLSNPWGIAVVPEPSTFALLCVGAIALLGYAWRRRTLQMFDKTTVRGFLTAASAATILAGTAMAGTITMTLPGTGFDVFGNALGNYGVDGNWTVSGSPYGSAAYVIVPGDPDFATGFWSVNTASNGWSGSSWINDNDQYDGGGLAPPAYTYSMSFSLAGFLLSDDLQISGMWGIDDTGTLAINGQTIVSGSGVWFENPPDFSVSYAANPTWFNVGTNIVTITMTGSDNYLDGVRFQGVVTGDAAVAPEPSALALLGAGALCLLGCRSLRRRQKPSLSLAGNRALPAMRAK